MGPRSDNKQAAEGDGQPRTSQKPKATDRRGKYIGWRGAGPARCAPRHPQHKSWSPLGYVLLYSRTTTAAHAGAMALRGRDATTSEQRRQHLTGCKCVGN